MQKTLVCGSRSITSLEPVREAFEESPFKIEYIIHGGAKGVDTSASAVASMMQIQEDAYSPDYDQYGNKAPLRRNDEMVKDADNLIAIWDGESNGTEYTIDKADQYGMSIQSTLKYHSGITTVYME